MPTITGTLQSILDDKANAGSIEIALCGYGSQVPRLHAQGLGARVTDQDTDIDPDGTFEFAVAGNDQILPDGTYYTVTVKDDNGDIVQVNAYVFLSTVPTYDLNTTFPYDPSQPPPPLPPLIFNELLVVASSLSPGFPGDQYTAWKIIVDQDIPGAFLSGIIPGNLYTFIIQQDAVGGHNFEFPTGPPPYGMRNVTMVCRLPNSTTVQTFVADDQGVLWAIGPGTWYA